MFNEKTRMPEQKHSKSTSISTLSEGLVFRLQCKNSEVTKNGCHLMSQRSKTVLLVKQFWMFGTMLE